MAGNSKIVVEFSSVTCRIGTNTILEDIDLQIYRGEVLVLLGESGCGKTTTLKLINRLIEPTAGEIRVDGKSTKDWDPVDLRRHIGYVLQDGGLFPNMSARSNVSMPLTIRGKDSKDGIVRADEMLELVGLDPAKFGDRFPHELSGGQRQRVGVARALAADPELLLLDEPFGALDALTRNILQREFARLVRQLQKTAVFVTHDLHEAILLGTRIALMDKGRIRIIESPDGFRDSGDTLARKYLETILPQYRPGVL